MDKLRFIPIFFLILLTLSCTSEAPKQEGFQGLKEPDLVSVKMNFTGEFSLSEVPLKNAEARTSDLFALQFYDNTNQPVAYIIGDDVSQISIDLHKEQEYRIRATYIKNGKNVLSYSPEIEEWSVPLISELRLGHVVNQIKYSSTDYIPFISHASVHVTGVDSNRYLEVDRYYGFVSSFTTTTEDIQTLTLDLKRMIFGLKLQFDLSNLENKEDIDQIRFSINGYGERAFWVPVSEGVATLEIPHLSIAVPEHENQVTALDLALDENYSENISISIGTLENGIKYFDGVIRVQRNKMMVIDHVLEEQETVEGGLGT